MKKFKCYDCDETFESKTSEEMLKLLMPHYMSEHTEIINEEDPTGEKKEAWMKKFNEDWEAVEEV